MERQSRPKSKNNNKSPLLSYLASLSCEAIVIGIVAGSATRAESEADDGSCFCLLLLLLAEAHSRVIHEVVRIDVLHLILSVLLVGLQIDEVGI